MKLGITGTREGCTPEQLGAIKRVLLEMRPTHLSQGCCTGADEQATLLARELFGPAVHITARPGEFASGGKNPWESRAAVDASDTLHYIETHFGRNRKIVGESDVLLAMPGTMREEEKGGTWFTIRFARQKGKRVVICWPDGTVSREGFGQAGDGGA